MSGSSNDSPPSAPPPDTGPTMDVFVTVAVATSAGAGPGPRTVPVAEGQSLIGRKYAIGGSAPPPNWPG